MLNVGEPGSHKDTGQKIGSAPFTTAQAAISSGTALWLVFGALVLIGVIFAATILEVDRQPADALKRDAWHNEAMFFVTAAGVAVLTIVSLLFVLVRTLTRLHRAARQQLDTALNNITQGVMVYDSDSRIVLFNRRYVEMYGLSLDVIRPGRLFRDVMKHRKETGSFEGDTDKFCDRVFKNVADRKLTHSTLTTKAGRSIRLVNQPLADGGWVATHEDITDLKRSEQQIAHLAHYDPLTDLPNRVLFRDRLEREFQQTSGDGAAFALLYIDIDEFKEINDSLGHAVGDEFLKLLAQRLTACISESEFVARLGGDEFAIIQTSSWARMDVEQLVLRVLTAIRAPFDCAGHRLTSDASIGIAIAPTDGADIDQLIKNADLAMYQAKASGRRTFRFFEPWMDAEARARRELALDLREAIRDGAFQIYYQPIVDIGSNAISGCEALLRWQHPQNGWISPADFIPVAEETGLIAELGEWVLTNACKAATAWPDHVKLAVNVSPVQFKSQTFALRVMQALATSGLTPGRLELEITETVLIRDDEAALAVLHQLRAIGVRIALDDFGTGYSSLSYLQRFPFDKIKIDRSFINALSNSDESSSIVQAVVTIANARNMITTAEGVETEYQLERLRMLGCTQMQGWLFSAAVPEAEVMAMVKPPSDHAAAQRSAV